MADTTWTPVADLPGRNWSMSNCPFSMSTAAFAMTTTFTADTSWTEVTYIA